MGITLREKIKQLPQEQQEKIRKRSAELMAEEKIRQQLRELFKITQEKRGQFILFEQWSYLGSPLKLFAEFPKRPPINLVGFSENKDSEKKALFKYSISLRKTRVKWCVNSG